MKRFMTSVVGVVGMVCLVGTTVFAQNAKQVDEGKKLYAKYECAKCHMIDGKGNKIDKLDGVAGKLSEADIRKWFTATTDMEAKLDHKPKVKMSSKKFNFTPAEVDALTAYMMSLK